MNPTQPGGSQGRTEDVAWHRQDTITGADADFVIADEVQRRPEQKYQKVFAAIIGN